MTEYLLKSLAVSLSLTEVLEVVFALVVHVRGRGLLLLLLVNVVTNPVVVLAHFFFRRYTDIPAYVIWPPLEAMAALAEALIYKNCGDQVKKPFLFSLGANAFSFGVGAMVNLIF